MASIKDTSFYHNAIQVINYPFGDYYLFDTFIVGEVHKDVVFNWEQHAKQVVEEITELYDQNGKNLVYISNRINPYSVVPSDWLSFYKYRYMLKGYAIVSYDQKGLLNTLLEKLFMRNKLQTFNNITDAITWAKSLSKKNKHNAA
ncbi:hypothetical protein M0D21_17960 [Aquimarina sp. D1M17]|uniref:hypothetical protein n=1 Tax=Aquimarina acroporae TaxID=2937283 RepID=UPI0020C00959|nr:hypothetical protein [Aquimarina acroporae]MCK8523473.1 hypothetical protein [Aquimarina acroporae]